MAIHTAGMGTLRGFSVGPGVMGKKRGIVSKKSPKKLNLRYSRSPISVAAKPKGSKKMGRHPAGY